LHSLPVCKIHNLDRGNINFKEFYVGFIIYSFFVFYFIEFLIFFVLKFFLLEFIHVSSYKRVSIFNQYQHQKVNDMINTKDRKDQSAKEGRYKAVVNKPC